MTSPILTIITINLNNNIGLERTITSLRKYKSIGDIEFIFIDGESKDNSLEIARTFYEETFITTEKDKGIYDAMNKGLAKSNGKFLLWLNSGDELHSELDMKDLLYKLKYEFMDYDVIGFAIEKKNTPNDKQGNILIPNLRFLPNSTLPHQSTIFKKSTVLKFGGYSLEYKICSDRDLLVKIYLTNHKIAISKQVISIFYLDGISSIRDTYPENLLISLNNNLITKKYYYIKISRYKLGNLKQKLFKFLLSNNIV